MNLIITLAAAAIIVAGVLIGQTVQTHSEGLVDSTDESEETVVVKDEMSELESDSKAPTQAPTPTSYVIIEDEEDHPMTSTSSVLDGYIYPDAKVSSMEQQSMTLSTSAHHAEVTDWYKERIKENGMSVTSFVTTVTNGNVLNKLVGANGLDEVKVSITKDAADSIVQIDVVLD